MEKNPQVKIAKKNIEKGKWSRWITNSTPPRKEKHRINDNKKSQKGTTKKNTQITETEERLRVHDT